jgi:predicted metal-binding membrane protein
MGIEHGAYCAGCCWLLMAILFVVGVMNVAWIVALSLYVLIEKVVPPNRWLAPASGAALMAWGAWLAVSGAH